VVNLLNIFFSKLARTFVPIKPFQSGLIFAGKAMSLLKRGTTERCSTKVCSGLTCKYWTTLARLAKDKRSGIFCMIICDEEKEFTTVRKA